MAKRIPRVTDPTKPPPGAVYFDVWRLHKQEGKSAEGKRYTTYKPKRQTGGVGSDGRVSDRWLVSELSPEAILARWGSGRYRIRYLGGSYELVGSVDWELQRPPEATGEPLAAGAEPAPGSPAERMRGLADRLDGAGVMQLMILMNDARESAARQAREDAERAAARDREWFRQMQEQTRSMMQQAAPAAAAMAAAAAPAAVDVGRELALMRRELALTLREETARLRQEILNELPEEPNGAETLTDALNGAGVGVVEALGGEVPSLVSDGLAKLRLWLRANGQPEHPQAVLQAIEAVRAAAMAEAQANGVGHEPQS